jgi:integrase
MGLYDGRSFPFTEARIEEAIRLVRDGQAGGSSDGRRRWRDEGSSHGLHLRIGRQGAAFYRIAKVGGRKVETRIGDATAIPLTKARQAALRLAAGDKAAAAAPVRVRTDGITVGQAWKAYIEDATSGAFVAGRRPTALSTIASYEGLYNPHLKKKYAHKSLHALAKDVHAIHRAMRSTPVAANRLLQVVSNLFVHAARAGDWGKPNPTLDPITGRTIRKYHVKPRERWYTTDEASRIFQFAATEQDPWCDFWPLLLLTGVRKSNLMQMRWEQLDLRDADALWAIPITKNQEPHVVPLSSEAVRILRNRKGRVLMGVGKCVGIPASPWVFPMKDAAERCIADCDNAWVRVRGATGVTNARIHDIRRTAGSWATQAGAPSPSVGKFIGDKSANATAVYARSDVAGARTVAEMVEKRLREASGGTE